MDRPVAWNSCRSRLSTHARGRLSVVKHSYAKYVVVAPSPEFYNCALPRWQMGYGIPGYVQRRITTQQYLIQQLYLALYLLSNTSRLKVEFRDFSEHYPNRTSPSVIWNQADLWRDDQLGSFDGEIVQSETTSLRRCPTAALHWVTLPCA